MEQTHWAPGKQLAGNNNSCCLPAIVYDIGEAKTKISQYIIIFNYVFFVLGLSQQPSHKLRHQERRRKLTYKFKKGF